MVSEASDATSCMTKEDLLFVRSLMTKEIADEVQSKVRHLELQQLESESVE